MSIDASKMGTLVDRVHRELTAEDIAKVADSSKLLPSRADRPCRSLSGAVCVADRRENGRRRGLTATVQAMFYVPLNALFQRCFRWHPVGTMPGCIQLRMILCNHVDCSAKSRARTTVENVVTTAIPAAGSPVRIALITSDREAPNRRACVIWNGNPLSIRNAASTAT